MQKVCENGYKQYIRSRPGASIESVKRAKDIQFATIGEHFLFKETADDKDAKAKLLSGISTYRPPGVSCRVGDVYITSMNNVHDTNVYRIPVDCTPPPPSQTLLNCIADF